MTPFLGYTCGYLAHYRAAPEVLIKITGTAFFSSGLEEFIVKHNDFLVFE
jgi:hypothetical protein